MTAATIRIVDRLTPFVVLMAVAFTGCTAPPGAATQRAHDRALEREPPSSFFASILARAKGEPPPEEMSPVARQHYLTVIAESENRSAGATARLRNQGLLGNALILRSLAEWRLGRLDAALNSKRQAGATGQQAIRARDRALAAALDGVVQLDKAIELSEAGGSFREVFDLIAGPSGAWQMLGQARMEAARTDEVFAELLETRLAAYKVVRDARGRLPPGTDGGVSHDRWSRMTAEAQVELNELARMPAANSEARAAKVREWRELTGLRAPPR